MKPKRSLALILCLAITCTLLCVPLAFAASADAGSSASSGYDVLFLITALIAGIALAGWGVTLWQVSVLRGQVCTDMRCLAGPPQGGSCGPTDFSAIETPEEFRTGAYSPVRAAQATLGYQEPQIPQTSLGYGAGDYQRSQSAYAGAHARRDDLEDFCIEQPYNVCANYGDTVKETSGTQDSVPMAFTVDMVSEVCAALASESRASVPPVVAEEESAPTQVQTDDESLRAARRLRLASLPTIETPAVQSAPHVAISDVIPAASGTIFEAPASKIEAPVPKVRVHMETVQGRRGTPAATYDSGIAFSVPSHVRAAAAKASLASTVAMSALVTLKRLPSV